MEKKQGFFEKLRAGLKKTRDNWFDSLFGEDRITEEFYEELEEAMILADMGAATASELIEALKEQVKTRKLKTCADTKQALIELIAGRVETGAPFVPDTAPAALLIVGVNGVGKTTSIGKIAHDYAERGRRPMLAAADTFRAAAAEQLGDWAQRAGVPMVRHQEGSDPAAVVYDSIEAAKARNADILLIDTAGRLHNKKNLMDELGKMFRIVSQRAEGCDVETLLVLDATTGQNAVNQAEQFMQAAKITGIVLTKLDGTAKGGIVVAIKNQLGLPVRYVGVGEKIDDLQEFVPEDFVEALFE